MTKRRNPVVRSPEAQAEITERKLGRKHRFRLLKRASASPPNTTPPGGGGNESPTSEPSEPSEHSEHSEASVAAP